MKPRIHPNQEKASNEIFELLKRPSVDVVRLTAEMQSGKTGAVLSALQKYIGWKKDKGEHNLKVLFLGPSDKQLKIQTHERVRQIPSINLALLGSSVWHQPEIVEGRNKGDILKELLSQQLELGGDVVVVWDESHIGIQKKKGIDKNGEQEVQVLPKFLKQFASLPGITTTKNVKHIMVTATPFSTDHFARECQDREIDLKFENVFLDPGENYVGVRHMLELGRIEDSLGPYSRKQKSEFLEEFVPLLEEHVLNNSLPKYYVVRCTVGYQISWYREACDIVGIKFEEFTSRAKNIPQFEDRLCYKPNDDEVLLIQRSYKQGKTLHKKHIGFWYEHKTKSGRNDADVFQSVGRNCGYHDYNTDYSVYMPIEQAFHAVEYYDAYQLRDLEKAMGMPLSDTATTRKPKKRMERDIFIADSFSEVEDFLKQKYGPSVLMSASPSKCSDNNKADVMEEGARQIVRQASQKGRRRYNIRYADEPNNNFKKSWDKATHLHGKYFVVYDVNNVTTIATKSNAVYDPDDIKVTKSA